MPPAIIIVPPFVDRHNGAVARTGAPTARLAQFGQRHTGAVLGYQAGFTEQPLTTALVALEVHHCAGIVGKGECDPHRQLRASPRFTHLAF
jgi:hypothetical protein